MKVAIPHWHSRVSPVFDVAGNILLIDVGHNQEHQRQSIAMTTTDTHSRAKQLAKLGVDVLICGAISQPLEMALVADGVEVIAQICGDVECVLAAFIERRLDQDTYLMPGCCRRRRRLRGQRRQSATEQTKLTKGNNKNV